MKHNLWFSVFALVVLAWLVSATTYYEDTIWYSASSPANFTLYNNLVLNNITVTNSSFISNGVNFTVHNGSGAVNLSYFSINYVNFSSTAECNMSVCGMQNANYSVWQGGTEIYTLLEPENHCVTFNWTSTIFTIINQTYFTTTTSTTTSYTTTTSTTTTSTTITIPPTTQEQINLLTQIMNWLRQMTQMQEDVNVGNDECNVIISNSTNFNYVVLNKRVLITEYNMQDYISPGVYYWRVRCYHNMRWGMWSDTWIFNVTTTNPVKLDWTLIQG